jgi:hypothetical protein
LTAANNRKPAGLKTAQELAVELENRGIVLVAAGRKTEWNLWAAASRLRKRRMEGEELFYAGFCN